MELKRMSKEYVKSPGTRPQEDRRTDRLTVDRETKTSFSYQIPLFPMFLIEINIPF